MDEALVAALGGRGSRRIVVEYAGARSMTPVRRTEVPDRGPTAAAPDE